MTTKTTLASGRDIAHLRSLLGTELPQYEWFVTTLGEGCLSGTVRVYSPARVLAENNEFRARVEEYFFWDGPGSAATPADLVHAVALADSVDGDEVVHVPGRGLLLLPRHDDVAVEVGPDLFAAVDYICFSGKVFEPDGDVLWFETDADRDQQFFHRSTPLSRDELAALAALMAPLASIPVKIDDGYLHVELPSMDGVLGVWGASATLTTDREADERPVVALLSSSGFRRVG